MFILFTKKSHEVTSETLKMKAGITFPPKKFLVLDPFYQIWI